MTEFGGSIPHYFEKVARAHRQRTAIVSAAGEYTYEALNLAANRLAHRLASVGQRGDRVALLLPHDRDIFVAILATLKSGRIFVVLNPLDPPPRLGDLIADCEPAVILTNQAHAARAASIAGTDIEVIGLDEPSTGYPSADPDVPVRGDEIACLTYTSGSTGRPKAVAMRHDTLVSSALANAKAWSLAPADRVALVASLWGAQGNNTAWATLLAGATLGIFPVVENGVTGLAKWLNDQRITVYASASSLFRHFTKTLDSRMVFPAIRLVRVSSDSATWEDFKTVRRHFPNAQMMHAMGASEVGGNIAHMMLSPDDSAGEGPLPVGRPRPDLDVRIVDEQGRDCPPGVKGVITVRSSALPAGYWRDPSLTAKRFFDCGDGTRMFRGEDLGFFNQDGLIVLAGRRDATHKIRGQRADIAEVERGLVGLPGVEDAAATVATRANGEIHLIGYVVAKPGSSLTPEKLRGAARAFMPTNLVPSFFVILDELPRTANGKIDRERLREIEPPAVAGKAEPPLTETERLLSRLWEIAFDVQGIGKSDGFLDLGGDSLIAAVIAAGIDAETGVQIPVGVFAENTSLKDMASILEEQLQHSNALDRTLAPVARQDHAPLSLLQEAFWPSSRAPNHSLRHAQTTVVRIEGKLDLEAFRTSLNHVVERHESLRTRFGLVDGAPVQIVEPAGRVTLRFVDLSGAANVDGEVTSLLDKEAERLFDLTAGPPVQFTLVKIADNRHLFVQSSHHIITDAQSWNIFASDLMTAYEATIAGDVPSLPPLPVQYADYSVWQRRIERRDGPSRQAAIAWYKKRFQAGTAFPGIGSLRRYWRTEAVRPTQPADWWFHWGLDPGSSEKLDALGRSQAATHYMVRLAAITPVLASLTASDRVAVRGIFTTRRRAALQGMFGLFANTLPLVLDCNQDSTFRDLVGHVRLQVAMAQEFAEIPFEELAAGLREEDVDIPGLPFWIHTTTPFPPVHRAGLQLTKEIYEGRRPVRGVIVLRLNQLEEENNCVLAFDPRIYRMAGMKDVADRLVRFIGAAAGSPDATIRELIQQSGIDRWSADEPGRGIPTPGGLTRLQA